MITSRFSRAACCAGLILLPAAALAQSAQDLLPRGTDLRTDPSREVSPPREESGPEAVIPGLTGPDGALVLKGIRLVGAEAVPAEALEPIWSELIGQEVGLAELQAVAEQIGAAYRGRGFILSQAVLPAQSVDDGIVEIVVVEGFVDQVEIAAEKTRVRDTTERLFGPVPVERPLRLETLERSVLLARDTYGADVETVLEPSAATFGAADLGVSVAPEPTSWFTTLDNRGSRLYGAWTLGGGSRSYDLLGLSERIDTLVAVAPFDGSLLFGSGTLDVPVPQLSGTWLDGGRFELRADVSRADPDLQESGSPEELSLLQNETEIRAGLIVPFVRTRSENLFGRAGFIWRGSESLTEFDGDETSSKDRLFIFDARLTWDVADRFGGVSLVEANLRKGLDVGGVSVGAEGPSAGEPDFLLGALTLSRLQRIAQSNWYVYGEAIGQIADDVLPSTERFSLGDSTIGRGYAPGNTSGDSGFGTRLEVRHTVAPEYIGTAADSVELYAYGDYGRAYDRSLARDGDTAETLASAGIGARIDIRPWLTITPEISRQLEGTPTDTTDPDLETRFYIGAVARF